MSYPYPTAPDASAYAPPAAGYPPPAADPYAAYYAGYAPPASHPDEIRTVFVTGFPPDVKERELNNMLRFLPGYEASQMNTKNGIVQGFALFDSGHSAQAAQASIQNHIFDETPSGVKYVLRCELARKNMYLKDEPTMKRPRYDAPAYGGYSAPPAAASYYPPSGGPAPAAQRGSAPGKNTGDNPPCNTLFVGNLGEATREDELQQLFSQFPGFKQVKLHRGPRSTTAFVEYADIGSATHVHSTQQGVVLHSSDRGGIRIQFSKNPFGRKRDFNGNFVETTNHAHGIVASTPLSSAVPKDEAPPGDEAVPGQD